MPPTSHRASWLSTYQVSTESRQQRILRAIHRLDDPGITALGATRDDQPIIVIECGSATAEIRSRQIVTALDLMAERLETTRTAPLLYDEAPPATTYLSGIAVPRGLLGLVPLERLRKLL